MAADLKDLEYWRFRAEEVLSIAGSLEPQETKKIMQRTADDLRAHSANGGATAGARKKIGMSAFDPKRTRP
jgi:hypothetical protein